MSWTGCIVPASHPEQRLTERHLVPRFVFARDDAWATQGNPGEVARIMIVEDDYLIASEMEGALLEAGFEVVGVATSAVEAIELARARQPLLAVMDVRLTGPRDGIDAALELFGTHGIRCIFATAHSNPEARERARSAQPLAWVRKPYAMHALVEAVRRAVRNLQDEGD